MSDLFGIINSVYLKKPIGEVNIPQEMIPTLLKWLSWDIRNVQYLKSLIPFLFRIHPTHFYYLLFFILPKRERLPFFKRFDVPEDKKNKELLKRIQAILEWSDKELLRNMKFIKQTILKDSAFWKEEVGLNEA